MFYITARVYYIVYISKYIVSVSKWATKNEKIHDKRVKCNVLQDSKPPSSSSISSSEAKERKICAKHVFVRRFDVFGLSECKQQKSAKKILK